MNNHPFWPMIRWRLSWYFKRSVLSHPPYYINIEPTNVCNLKCPMCSLDDSRDRGFMDEDLFRRIASDAAGSGVTEARLFLAGEPLLHGNIADFVRIAGEYGLVTCIHTNATRLTEEMSEALIDAGLRIISFSFDGETPEEYERMRVGAKFDEVMGNMLRFLEIKRSRGGHLPETILQMIKPFSQDARFEISPEFGKRFEGLPVDRFLLLRPHSWAGEVSEAGEKPRGGMYFPCQALWQSMSVGWDGSVLACCGDLNGRVVLGDLKTATVNEVWNSPNMVRMRQSLVNRDAEKCALCRNCDALWRNHHPVLSDLRDILKRRLV